MYFLIDYLTAYLSVIGELFITYHRQ